MNLLPPKIKLRGLGFDIPVFATVVERNDHKAIYKVNHPTGHIYYEVFQIRKGIGKFLPSGAYKPAGELYPGNDDFGKTAWCINDLDRAMDKYLSL
jgi:hypothetical protein